jgi:hypothetical protein
MLRTWRWYHELIALVLLSAVVLAVVWPKTHTAAFHNDEAHKISEAYYFHLFFLQHDWRHPDWQADFYARTNPPVAKYIMGAFLKAMGHQITDRSLQDKFEALWRDNQRLSREIPISLLMSARVLSAILAVPTILLIYWIGRWKGGLITGLAGSLLLLSHPKFQYYASVALTDIILMFFMTAGVVLTLVVGQRFGNLNPVMPFDGRREILQATAAICIAGCVIAAAAGTKLNGALTGILFTSTLIAVAAHGRFVDQGQGARSSTKTLLLIASAAAVLGGLLFVAINPYLYDAPVSKTLGILRVYGDWMVKQRIEPGEPLWLGVQKFTAIAGENFIVPQSVFYLGTTPCMFVAFAVGVGFIVIEAVTAWRNREIPIWHFTTGLWIAIYGIGIGCWIPVDWDRYFLPIAPLIAVTTAYGLVSAARLCFARSGNYRSRRALVAVASTFLALTLWYNGRDCSMLPPRLAEIQLSTLAELRQTYKLAEQRDSPSSLQTMYAADMRMILGDFAGARDLYRRVIVALRAAEDKPMERTLRAIVQYRLTGACLKLSRVSEAKNALQVHIQTLEAIANDLSTSDPKVHEEFAKLIAERKRRKQLLDRITAPPREH